MAKSEDFFFFSLKKWEYNLIILGSFLSKFLDNIFFLHSGFWKFFVIHRTDHGFSNLSQKNKMR